MSVLENLFSVCWKPSAIHKFGEEYIYYQTSEPQKKKAEYRLGVAYETFANLTKPFFNNKDLIITTKICSLLLLSFHLCCTISRTSTYIAATSKKYNALTCKSFVQHWTSNGNVTNSLRNLKKLVWSSMIRTCSKNGRF